MSKPADLAAYLLERAHTVLENSNDSFPRPGRGAPTRRPRPHSLAWRRRNACRVDTGRQAPPSGSATGHRRAEIARDRNTASSWPAKRANNVLLAPAPGAPEVLAGEGLLTAYAKKGLRLIRDRQERSGRPLRDRRAGPGSAGALIIFTTTCRSRERGHTTRRSRACSTVRSRPCPTTC